MTRYAVVPAPGCYGSGDLVSAITTCADLDRALQIAQRETTKYRVAMAPHGGSSGGYRVVETDATTRSETCWGGWELDSLPDAEVSR